ncbi:DNA polymerase I, partial [Patescibacteria group bacterium]|nr:DNA polymerase I [Patescibacteria group bacterium]
MSRLLIIDGHAVIHRAYHSIPKNLTYNGQVVNALYGFYSMLLSSISQLNPKYLIICLDSPGPTFRDKEYIAYRAQRQPSDPELISQLPLVKQTLEEITIPSFALGGYEADDIIATIAKNKAPLVSKVTIITGDKDLMQLVNTKTQLFMPIRGISQTKTFFIKDVKQKLGIYPKQVVDMKALMGDPSDNYPGVHGIGPKTATTLLNQYKNLDNIYKNINKIKA